IEFAIGCGAKGLVQRVQNGLLADVERFIALALLLKANHDVILRAGIQDRVADGLDGAVRDAGRSEAFANLIDGSGAGEANVNQRATAEIDAVLDAAILQNRGPAKDEQDDR